MTLSRTIARARQTAAGISAAGMRASAQKGRIDSSVETIDIRLDDSNFDSLPRYAETAWTFVRNFRARGGRLEKINGHRYLAEQVNTPPANVIRDAVFTNRYAVPYIITQGKTALDATSIYVTDGTTHNDITVGVNWAADADPLGFSSCVLNGVPVIGHAAGVPYYFTPPTTLTALPGWLATDRAKVIRSHRSHLFALGLGTSASPDLYPSSLRWSDAADPGTVPQTWTPAASTEAGNAELSGTPGNIVDGLTLGDLFIVYKTGATYTFSFIGGTFIYTNRITFSTTGALNKNCIAPLLRHHIVAADGDIIAHDGTQVRSIVDGRLRRWFNRQIDVNNVDYVRAQYYPKQKEVWIGIPDETTRDIELAMIYDMQRDKWGVRDFGQQADHPTIFIDGGVLEGTRVSDWTDTQAWEDDATSWGASDRTLDGGMVGFANGGRFIGYDLEATQNTANAVLQRAGLDLGYPEQLKTVTRIYPRANAPFNTPELIARVGTQARDGGPVTWGPEIMVGPETGGRLDYGATGRLIAVELKVKENETPGAVIDGFGLEFHIGGFR